MIINISSSISLDRLKNILKNCVFSWSVGWFQASQPCARNSSKTSRSWPLGWGDPNRRWEATAVEPSTINHQPSTHPTNISPPPGGQRFPVAPRKKTRTLIRSSCVLHEPGPYSAVVLIYGSTESWCGHEQDFTCAGTRIGIHLFACLAIYHQ